MAWEEVPTLEFQGVQTLPLFFVYAQITDKVPPFGKGSAVVVAPPIEELNYAPTIIAIPSRADGSASIAIRALDHWIAQVRQYCLRAQFLDDRDAIRYRKLLEQTSELSRYLEAEQSVDSSPLIEATRVALEFANVHFEFRSLENRELRRTEFRRRLEGIFPVFRDKMQVAETFVQRMKVRLDDVGRKTQKANEAQFVHLNTGTSEQVDFVFVTALDEERDALLRLWPSAQAVAPSHNDVRFYYKGTFEATFPDGSKCTYSAVLVPLNSMGRVSAALAASDAIRRWQPRYVILVGIAGGIESKGVSLGDILISDQVVDYETQKITEGNTPDIRWNVQIADPRLLGAARNMRVELCLHKMAAARPDSEKSVKHVGSIATGDKIVAAKDLLKQHGQVWTRMVGVEMEAGGVATAATESPHKPGFFMVRAVSDLADADKNLPNVIKWRPYACDLAAAFAVTLVESGPIPPR